MAPARRLQMGPAVPALPAQRSAAVPVGMLTAVRCGGRPLSQRPCRAAGLSLEPCQADWMGPKCNLFAALGADPFVVVVTPHTSASLRCVACRPHPRLGIAVTRVAGAVCAGSAGCAYAYCWLFPTCLCICLAYVVFVRLCGSILSVSSAGEPLIASPSFRASVASKRLATCAHPTEPYWPHPKWRWEAYHLDSAPPPPQKHVTSASLRECAPGPRPLISSLHLILTLVASDRASCGSSVHSALHALIIGRQAPNMHCGPTPASPCLIG